MNEPAADLAETDRIAERLVEVNQRIEAVRQPDQQVRIVAVTKTLPAATVQSALRAGLVDLGENYAQELEAKAAACRDVEIEAPNGPASPSGLRGPRWHFIGGLQRNKIKRLASEVAVWQSIDRVSLIDELAKRASGASMMLQVNTTAEHQKSGCRPEDAQALVAHARLVGLDVIGLMTVGPTGGGDPTPSFARLRSLADRCGVNELSMGMSGDYERAVAAGATVVRLGTVLFGPRPRKLPTDPKVSNDEGTYNRMEGET